MEKQCQSNSLHSRQIRTNRNQTMGESVLLDRWAADGFKGSA